MIGGGDRLSDAEAQRVWRRAAELQAAAAEPQSRAPAPSAALGQPGGYTSTQIREAAAEAGIAPEFVALALAEGYDADSAPPDRVARWAQRLSGPEPRALVVSRRFERPIDEVYAAVRRVFPSQGLALVDAHDEPRDGGMLVFALPRAGAAPADAIVTELAGGAPVEEMRLQFHTLDPGSCVVTVSAPWRARLSTGALGAVGGGIVGGWAVGALGAAVLLPLGIGATATAAAIGGAVLLGLGGGGRLGVAVSNAVRQTGRRRGTTALERLLQAVGLELRGKAVDASSR